MTPSPTVEHWYRQAESAALAVRHRDPGLIGVTGRDRLDLMNRMSTNKVDDLSPGRHVTTVLTNPVGQTVDRLELLSLDDQLILVTSPGRAQRVLDWLSAYIFFQDQVVLEPFDGTWALWGCYGPSSAQEAEALLGGPTLPSAGELRILEAGMAWQAPGPLAPGWLILLDPAANQRAEARWPDHGPDSPAGQAFEILRIERGFASVGQEILDDTIPLEAGLWDAVSFSKGCYIGQEIIARLESRGRLAKQLMRVRLEGQAPADTDLFQSGRRVGRLSSVARSPALGWIGLALVQPAALDSHDGRVLAGSGGIPGRLLPLPSTAPEATPS